MLVVAACLFPLVGWVALRAYDVRDNSVLGWLPEQSPVTLAYRNFRRIFGSDEAVLASWEGCTLDEPALERFAAAVEAHRQAAAAAGIDPDRVRLTGDAVIGVAIDTDRERVSPAASAAPGVSWEGRIDCRRRRFCLRTCSNSQIVAQHDPWCVEA